MIITLTYLGRVASLEIARPVRPDAGGSTWASRFGFSTRRCATANRRPGSRCGRREKLLLARQLDALGVDIIEAGFPIASPADAEAVPPHRDRDPASGDRVPGACHPRRPREGGLVDRAGGARPHPHVHRHLRSAPAGEAAHHARAVPRGGGRRGPLRAAAHRRRRSSRRRTRRAATSISCAASSRRSSRPARRRSTCPIPSATPRRTRRATSSARSASGCRTRTRWCSARTATTTSAWPSPTRWRPCRAARGRSSARSTASASAPATRRSKRS